MSSSISRSSQENPLIDFWKSLKTSSSEESSFETTNFAFSSFESTSKRSAEGVNWIIENRGGLAKIAGLALVPAQYITHDHAVSNTIIDEHLEGNLNNGYIEKISIPLGENSIQGIICYPKNWKKEDNSHCLLYHNPNGVCTAAFFQEGNLSWTPGEIFTTRNCPIILYDYRGVGLNQDITPSSTSTVLNFHATCESVVADGQAALKYALSKFEQVEVMGSSLGGGVATASLDRHITKNPEDSKRILQLINHDSFTTTPRVVFPNNPFFAGFIGHVVGANLDAMTPMKSLIEGGVKVTVLCHTNDPVIPFGSRMGDFVQTLPKKNNATVFTSPHYGHADLSDDMLNVLFDQPR